MLSPCLFNLHAEYIMCNAKVDEAQAGIKIAKGNINNFRYADDTTLMAESKEIKSIFMKDKEESEKFDLKLNIQIIKIMVSSPITSCKINRKKWKQWPTISCGYKITVDGNYSHEIKRLLLLGRRAMTT